MVWHVLAEPDAVYEDLGTDWFSRRDDSAAPPFSTLFFFPSFI